MEPNYFEPKFHGSHFGDSLEYPFSHDPAKPIMILFGGTNHLTPITILLPGQVYRKNLEQLAAEHGYREFVLLPCNLDDAKWFKWPPARQFTGPGHLEQTGYIEPSTGDSDAAQ